MFICTQNKLINQGIALKSVKTMLAQETRSLTAPKPTEAADRPGPVNYYRRKKRFKKKIS
jgi:hypothetical protein